MGIGEVCCIPKKCSPTLHGIPKFLNLKIASISGYSTDRANKTTTKT